MNYFFFGPGAISGPSVEYKDINDFLNMRGRYASFPKHGHLYEAFKRFIHAYMMLGYAIFLGTMYSVEHTRSEEFA